jgi:hypothetical protein
MKEYNPSVIKEYNPSDSKEKPVYKKIGRRGFLIAAGVTLAAGCGGKKETTPEQTSGQLPEHVESSGDTPSPEESPTSEGMRKLDLDPSTGVELCESYVDTRAPEEEAEELTIPASAFDSPDELMKHVSNIVETIINVFADKKDQENPPSSEYSRVYDEKRFRYLAEKNLPMGSTPPTFGSTVVPHVLDRYKGLFENPGKDANGKQQPIKYGDGFKSYLVDFANAQEELRIDPGTHLENDENGLPRKAYTDPIDPEMMLGPVTIEGMEHGEPTYDGDTVSMFVSFRPDNGAQHSEKINNFLTSSSVGHPSLGWTLAAGVGGMQGTISFRKTGPGKLVISKMELSRKENAPYSKSRE